MVSEREHLTKCLDRCDVLTKRVAELEMRIKDLEAAIKIYREHIESDGGEG